MPYPSLANNADIVLIHRGGLGDFLMAWPAMWNIRTRFLERRIFWHGSESRLHWLRPLGVEPCPPEMRRLVDSLFQRVQWPEQFGDTRIFWFVLNTRPPVPEHPNLHVVPGFAREPGCPGSDNRLVPPRDVHARHLKSLGLGWNPDWPAAWRGFFGRSSVPETPPGNRVLLFPGAGHVAKQWPMVQFLELARWLIREGREAHFVLGPAELERGMAVGNCPVISPNSLLELQEVLQSADVVVGNDSGPMHLAGMLGVPGVALFGPASEQQWGPLGLRTVGLDLPCRPCTQTGRISCENPACMTDIPQDMVRRAIETLWKI